MYWPHLDWVLLVSLSPFVFVDVMCRFNQTNFNHEWPWSNRLSTLLLLNRRQGPGLGMLIGVTPQKKNVSCMRLSQLCWYRNLTAVEVLLATGLTLALLFFFLLFAPSVCFLGTNGKGGGSRKAWCFWRGGKRLEELVTYLVGGKTSFSLVTLWSFHISDSTFQFFSLIFFFKPSAILSTTRYIQFRNEARRRCYFNQAGGAESVYKLWVPNFNYLVLL